MKRSKLILPLLLFVMVISACSPGAASVPTTPILETPVVSQPLPTTSAVPAAIEAARQDLANQLSIDPGEVNVVDFEQVEWTDSCLGLGGPAESCLAAMTPGYSVTLEAGGEQYAYRTDLQGTAVRQEIAAGS